MDLKNKIRVLLREQYGEFITELEHEYESVLTDNLSNESIKKRKAWATYNQVILELRHSLKDNLRVKEIQYKLTDNLDPNEVIIEVIKNIKTFTPELERLYFKIINF